MKLASTSDDAAALLPGHATANQGRQFRLYSLVWRWHFYAGLLVSPVILLMAGTGALLIFQDRLERVLYPGTMSVTPARQQASYEQQVAAAQAVSPPGSKVAGLGRDADPSRPTAVFMRMPSREGFIVYVDPADGHVLGDNTQHQFFDTVETLHRRLFLGPLGALVVELTTCWTIVLLLTGAYLWWPRKDRRLWGVLLPRLRGHPYVVLRDLHSVCGISVWLVALICAGTGLFYSSLTGSAFKLALRAASGFVQDPQPPSSRSPVDATTVPVDRILAIAHSKFSDASLTVFFPDSCEGVFVVYASWAHGPTYRRVLALDRASGEILDEQTNGNAGWFRWWATWNFPLHAGSLAGTPTQVIWLLGCLGLMLLPVTGVWMWWQRRPPGQTGFPGRAPASVPRWLTRLIIILGILLPMFGLSVAVLVLGERGLQRLRKVQGRA